MDGHLHHRHNRSTAVIARFRRIAPLVSRRGAAFDIPLLVIHIIESDLVCNPCAKEAITLHGRVGMAAAFSLAWTCYSASVSAVSIAQGPTAGTEAAESLENNNEMS